MNFLIIFEIKTIKGMNSVDPMIFFSNILLIHQLLCANTDSKETSIRSGYMYPGEEFMDNPGYLQDESGHESDLRRARITEYLQILNDRILRENAKTRGHKNLKTSYHELPKTVRFVYETMRFSLYFSVQQEDNAEPPGGLKVSIDETSIEIAKCIFAKYRSMFLKLVVHRLLEDLSDLGDIIRQFYFITDLHIINYSHLNAYLNCKPCKTVLDFINLEKIQGLRTLKITRMIVTDEFLEKVSSMTLESLSFTKCVFLTSDGTEKQPKEIKLAFGESYRTVCFNMCSIYVEDIKSRTCPSHYAMIIIELNKCINLRTLKVNSDRYMNVVFRNKIIVYLWQVSLDGLRKKPLLVSSRCSSAKLEYLSIEILDVRLAVKFLKTINKKRLKHLMLTYSTCEHYFDVVDILGIDFVALEVLEIDASSCDLELKSNHIGRVNVKTLKSLKIKCWRANGALIQMINEQKSLKLLKVELIAYEDNNYEFLLRKCSLENSLNDLFISSYLTLKELITLINRYKQVKVFHINSKFVELSCDSTDIQFLESSKQALNSDHGNVAQSRLEMLCIHAGGVLPKLIEFMAHPSFAQFANVKKLVIKDGLYGYRWNASIDPESFERNEGMLLNILIENIFKTFNRLEVLIINDMNDKMPKKMIDCLDEFFSARFKSVKMRYEWSNEYDEERVVWELHK